MKKMLLGAHMPVAGGLESAAKFGQAVGCSAIQIFTKSNRQWAAKAITDTEADQFKAAIKACNINYVMVHACYLINICSPETDILHKSTTALATELKRCSQLGIRDLVLHPGARKTAELSSTIKQAAAAINLALSQSPQDTRILLETMAGQGSSVGSNFEELAQILALVRDQDRVGICLDTCHIFASGLNFDTIKDYEQLWRDFDKTIGRSKLGAIHLNDSQKGLGSKVDRHENIGKGKIGISGFEYLMNDPLLINLPKIMETPKMDLADDQQNMAILLELLTVENQKSLFGTNLESYLR